MQHDEYLTLMVAIQTFSIRTMNDYSRIEKITSWKREEISIKTYAKQNATNASRHQCVYLFIKRNYQRLKNKNIETNTPIKQQ